MINIDVGDRERAMNSYQKLHAISTIRYAIDHSGLKRYKIAEALGMSTATLNHRSDNPGNWTLDELFALASTLHISIDELLGARNGE